MSIKYLDLDGLSHFKSKLDSEYVSQETGKGLSTNDYTDQEKTKLAGIETGAEENVIESVVVNGTTATIANKVASVTISAGAIDSISVNGTPQTIDANKNVDITVPTNNNQLTNGAGYQTSAEVESAITSKGYQTATQVNTAIDNKISSTYKAKGSVAFANLPALDASREGFVYNITDSFTTTSDFVEGAGKEYPAGTNIVIINTTGDTYKYDVLGAFVDLSGYVEFTDLVAITNAEINALFA